MPDKTHGEQLRELNRLVAYLNGSVDRITDAIKIMEERLIKLHDQLITLNTKMVLVEHQVGELKKEGEEAKQWRRSLVGPLLAAIIGSTLTALLGLLLYLLRD